MNHSGAYTALPKVYVEHFGCRLNQYETLSIESANPAFCADYELTRRLSEADFVVINTCTVTNRADSKNRQAIRKAHRENPGAKIIVTGCYAVTDADELKNMEGVYRVLGNDQKHGIAGLISQWRKSQNESPIEPNLFPFTPQSRERLARAYLKIQDGCSRRCSYCKIPHARGRAVSRPLEESLKEARELVEAGFGEIILTGVNTGEYKSGGCNFTDLVKRLAEIEGDFQIRISSLEPDLCDDELLELFSSSKIARFLHLPQQSGSERVLKQMRRSHSATEIRRVVSKIRRRIPEIHIGTDIIVGFPGESDEDFQETLALCEELKFANVHIFPFSQRDGTKAAEWLQSRELAPVHGSVIKERTGRLAELTKRHAQEYLAATAGREFRAIVENPGPGEAKVITENFVKCSLEHPPAGWRKGGVVRVVYDGDGRLFLG